MNMVIKESASFGEGVMAFILLMINYQKKGYVSIVPTWKSMSTLACRYRDYMQRVRTLNQDPSKGQVVVAKKHGFVIGTVCVESNPTTLSIDEIFPKQMARLHASALPFVYLGSFAVASSYSCTRLALRMLRYIWSVVINQEIELGICVVHPDHIKCYVRFGFVEIARSQMPGLDQAPAALLVVKRQDVRL